MEDKENKERERLKARLEGMTEKEAQLCNEILDEPKIKTVSIPELMEQGQEFVIPAYQRGYRWETEEVEDMLRDIEEASKDNNHCLQILTVAKRNNKCVIIDGQQRLTTLAIIQTWCCDEQKLKIKYESRKNSESYIKDILYKIKKKGLTQDNTSVFNQIEVKDIDYQFMLNTYKTCIEKHSDQKDKISANLNYCFFIVYELNNCDIDKEKEIFNNINSGKISLTNTELIKALLFSEESSSGLGSDKYIEETIEWDEIMRLFSDDEFWYFICPNPSAEQYGNTRADYLMELVTGENYENKLNRYATFKRIYKDLKNDPAKSSEIRKIYWDRISGYYRIMKYWYHDKSGNSSDNLFHIIGYLNAIGKSNISEWLQKYSSESKKEFKSKRKSDIMKHICAIIAKAVGKQEEQYNELPCEEDYSQLLYGLHNKDISEILLLFNIILLENERSEHSRYPFDVHKKEKWTLEHIHAQNDDKNKNNVNRESVEAYCKLILDTPELRKELDWEDQLNWTGSIRDWVNKTPEDELKLNLKRIQKVIEEIKDITDEHTIQKLYKCLMNCFANDINYDTYFGNLALLPQGFNSSMSNKNMGGKRKAISHSYSSQRERISKLCNPNRFDEKERINPCRPAIIPIGTRYAFFKYFSPTDASNLVWTSINAKDYVHAIANSISEYFKQPS